MIHHAPEARSETGGSRQVSANWPGRATCRRGPPGSTELPFFEALDVAPEPGQIVRADGFWGSAKSPWGVGV